MVGFAVFMTIVTFAFVGLVIACVLSAVLYRVAKGRTRRRLSSQRATVVCAVAPFLGLLWFALAFLIHVQISNGIAHQDCGLSGDPYVTLPNGYILGSYNTYDGYFKAPGYNRCARFRTRICALHNPPQICRTVFHRNPVRFQNFKRAYLCLQHENTGVPRFRTGE